jgi:hypothetical protein
MKPSDYIRKGWCQGASAKDDLGIVVSPGSPHAASWCLLGSVIAAYQEDMHHREQLVTKLANKMLGVIPTRWNDMPVRKQVEVVALLQSIGE